MESVSRETLEKLRHYQSLLLKWQDKINLISPKTISNSWERHFLDSTQILTLLPEKVETITDIGSGAGFPGMVLAICRPEMKITLIESDSKKCAFLKAVSRETKTSVSIQNGRIEEIVNSLDPPSVVTARALAPLSEILKYIEPWLLKSKQIRLILPKGEQFSTEIEEAQRCGWSFMWSETASCTDKSGRILNITDIYRQ